LQCIVCGKDEVFLNNTCKDCFSAKHTLVTIVNRFNLNICYFCASAKVKKSWVEYQNRQEAMEAAVVRELHVDHMSTVVRADIDFEPLDEHSINAHVTVMLSVQGEELTEGVNTTLNLSNGVCDNCSRAVGNYYEAIIQIRAVDRPLFPDEHDEIMDLVKDLVGEENSTDSSVFISKVEELKTGTDFYLSSSSTGLNLMRRLSKQYGGQTKQSSKLVGRKDGRDLCRTTYLVRLPNWRRGDVVDIDGRYYVVLRMEPSKLISLDLATRKQATFKTNKLKNVKVHRKAEISYNAVVVNIFKRELSLLDPITMETKTILIPEGYGEIEKDAEEVAVFRIDEELILA